MFARLLASLLLLAGAITAARAESPPLRIPALDDRVNVFRDSDGIVHILARTEHDAVLIQGWVHARDRLFQMDVLRRQASGTLAELLGPDALPSDVEFRTLGLRRAAERSWLAVSDETGGLLEAYAEGVNAYVTSHTLPPEYGALEITAFDPWTPVDTLTVAKLIAAGLSFDLADIDRTIILQTYQGAGDLLGFDGTALFFQDTHRTAPFDPAATIPDASAAAATAAAAGLAAAPKAEPTAAAVDGTAADLARRYRERAAKVPFFKQAFEFSQVPRGSNEWAVGGMLTDSGQPIIANDPHLELGAPATFYQIHLMARREGLEVIGSGFAGTPYIAIGQNQRIAWGATFNPMDVTDVYLETIVPDGASPSGLSTVYLGALEPIIPIPETFRFNVIGDGVLDNLLTAAAGGDIPAATLIVPRRNNGPIVSLDPVGGTALSVQYTGFSATHEIEAFRAWNKADDMGDFLAGLDLFDVGSQNFSYADVRGHIAYFMSAEMPLREDLQANTVVGLPPYFIRNGTGGNEWLPVVDPEPGQAIPYAILPFEEMPQIVDPPAGYFVNANNDPTGLTLDNDPLNQLRPGGGIFYLNPGYSFGARAGRITQALLERFAAGPVSADDMRALQADTVMLDAQVFTPFILQAFDNAQLPGAFPALAALAADPRVAEAVGRLAAWDRSAPTGVPEGYDAGDVDGDRLLPEAAEIEASIAATIYAVWRGQVIGNSIDAVLDGIGLPRPADQQTLTALRHLLDSFGTGGGIGASGLDFFPVPGAPDRASARDTVILKSLADALDLLAGDAFAQAFGHSPNQSDYRWGRLHRIVLAHPLGGPFDIPPAGGAVLPSFPDLPGLAVDGGYAVIDRSDHSARADHDGAFVFDAGPVRRYVGEANAGRRGFAAETILPGGSSGVIGSPFHVNLLGRWLTNDTYPMRQRQRDFIADAVERNRFLP